MVRARSPSLSRSSTYMDFCQLGRFCTKYLANTLARSMYSTTRACLVLESFDLLLMVVEAVFMVKDGPVQFFDQFR